MATERPGPSRLLTGGFLAAALVVGGALGALEINGLASPLDRIENLTLDWRFLLAGARPAPSGVVIVAIDDEALSEAGSDAPTREMMARIVRALAGFHPRSIAIDIAFLNSRDAEADTELAERAQGGAGCRRGDRQFRSRPILQAEQPNRATWRLAPKPSSVLWPIDAIRDAAQVGLANVSTDSSGVPRYIPMIYQTPDGVVPSFALAAASQGLRGRAGLGSRPDRDRGPVERNGPRLSHAAAFLWARGKLQAHQRGTGPSRRSRSRRRCVAKSSLSGSRRRARPTTFATPFDRVAPGAEVFATAIGNLMAGDGLARTPRPAGSMRPRRLRFPLS